MLIYCLSMIKRYYLILLLALLLLSGCGQSLSVQTPQKTPVLLHSGSTPHTAGTSSPALLGTGVAFNLGGWLHVQTISGFTCSPYNLTTPAALVLPKVLPIYDQGTLQSVKNYVNAGLHSGDLDNYTGHRDTVPYPTFSANPASFQLAAVSEMDPIGGASCDEILHITNIGKTPVQIPHMSVQYTADTQTNHQHYNLIDVCTLLSLPSPCNPSLGSNEGVYVANFNLHAGKAHTITSTDVVCEGCPPLSLTLKPGEVAKVILTYGAFYSASDNLSFSLTPSFTLEWPGKQITLPASQLQETFAFAFPSQFSCYALQGQQFIQVPRYRQYPFNIATNWCI